MAHGSNNVGGRLLILPCCVAFVALFSLLCLPQQQGTTLQDHVGMKIVERARREVERGVFYDASYRRIAYPNGDVPLDRGACTDVLIRALRTVGCDLQKLIASDKRRNPSRYPNRGKADTNIDHRRVINHLPYLRMYAETLPTSTIGKAKATWQAGDLVYWKLDNNLDHCGILSDRRSASGLPLVIHNIGGASEEDVLTRWKIVAHFRYPRRKLPVR